MNKWAFNGFYTKPQLIRYANSIPFRKSCRDFTAPPSFEQWSVLSYAAGRVCLPGVRIVLAHCDESFFISPFFSIGRISGAQRFAALLIDQSIPNALLHAGISGEAFVLEALSCGVSTCWVTGTYRKKENPVTPEENESVAAVIALGLGSEKIAEPIKRKKKIFSKGEKRSAANWPSYILNAANLIEAAPSALNRKPWTTEYKDNIFSLASKEFLDLGIALLHGETAFYSLPHLWEYEPIERGLKVSATFINPF